jgi:hypothetical protein
MGFSLVTALLVAFLLSNLALRPMEELSEQLDYWTPSAEEPQPEEREAGHRPARFEQDRAHRPAHA